MSYREDICYLLDTSTKETPLFGDWKWERGDSLEIKNFFYCGTHLDTSKTREIYLILMLI